ncbi:hypothetical protein COW53_05630 [bacterium CG17_big_fil_post_rev_8_21_14_2_50_64_8]|nr:MAG: hypothetical protein COW53_05630 [bacterium CG17_big_fil_post_rev_8_21_14_2_50_64_8]PJA73908.1 MAG: hypothetical protein CO151_11015 [bacterium CG_4_9_14_3_um_filter_65_15]
MKRFALVTALLLVALGAQTVVAAVAPTIYDIQNGVYAAGDTLTVTGTVVAVRYNGIWVAEAPFGAYNGIWVYMGSTTNVPGDIVDVTGVYSEYYGLTELAAITDGVVTTGTGPVPAPTVLDAATLTADPEPWESCAVTISDGMHVTETSDVLGHGYWTCQMTNGTVVNFDDYFYDDTTVLLGQCYNNATGIWEYTWSAFRMEPYVDGYPLVDCVVDDQEVSFGDVKSLFR